MHPRHLLALGAVLGHAWEPLGPHVGHLGGDGPWEVSSFIRALPPGGQKWPNPKQKYDLGLPRPFWTHWHLATTPLS
eukprot:9297191-Pyramimonas_sp.AAC.1